MMRRIRSNASGRMSENSTTTSSKDELQAEIEWEMRPGGMLVQKRIGTSDISTPNLRLRITFGAVRYEISVNSEATFGEVKKVLTVETGLQPGEQRLIFRGKERENGEYLDRCGVKDRSKLILMEDPASIEKRCIEMRRNARIQTAHRAISDISFELDKLADQVAVIEKSISSGVKVSEVQITTLIEMLMRHAIKLDNIPAEGDASVQKNLQESQSVQIRSGQNFNIVDLICMQGKRVQKCVETLDVLKISNAGLKPVVVTTKWETFDPPPNTAHWEIFD